jgi:anti-sigma regulatory factor (Ser/Thr protein kinase)
VSGTDRSNAVPARPENVAVVRQAMRRFLEGFRLDQMLLGDILLALTEATTNCVVHAYREEPGVVDITARLNGERLDLVVRDNGAGIQPRIDSPGLGLGLPVIIALAETVEIGPNEGGGTEVAMSFDLSDERTEAASR